MRTPTTGGGPFFTCHKCGAQYPEGNVHHCATTFTQTVVAELPELRLALRETEIEMNLTAARAAALRKVVDGLSELHDQGSS